jgi:hypothetical protein
MLHAWGDGKLIKVSVEKREQNRSVGRPSLTWDDDITICIKEIWCENVDRIHLVQDKVQRWAFVNTMMNLGVLWGAGKLLASWENISFSESALLYGGIRSQRTDHWAEQQYILSQLYLMLYLYDGAHVQVDCLGVTQYLLGAELLLRIFQISVTIQFVSEFAGTSGCTSSSSSAITSLLRAEQRAFSVSWLITFVAVGYLQSASNLLR